MSLIGVKYIGSESAKNVRAKSAVDLTLATLLLVFRSSMSAGGMKVQNFQVRVGHVAFQALLPLAFYHVFVLQIGVLVVGVGTVEREGAVAAQDAFTSVDVLLKKNQKYWRLGRIRVGIRIIETIFFPDLNNKKQNELCF